MRPDYLLHEDSATPVPVFNWCSHMLSIYNLLVEFTYVLEYEWRERCLGMSAYLFLLPCLGDICVCIVGACVRSSFVRFENHMYIYV